MPAYKLQYFDIRGRAEIMRLIFAEAGQKYEDVRFTPDQWKAEKPNTPFGQLPVLYVGEKPLAQSTAIVRYLAREFKLDGTTSLESAYIDMLMESIGGAFEKLPYTVKDENERKEKMATAFKDHIYPTLSRIENKFKALGGDYLVGKKFSVADIYIASATFELANFKPDVMKEYPCLLALQKRVFDRPNIKKWIEKRPVSAY